MPRGELADLRACLVRSRRGQLLADTRPMNEHALSYAAAAEAPTAVPTPAAPPALPALPAPLGFAMPSSAAAALDVSAPLTPLQPAAPMQPAAPAQPQHEQVMPAPINFVALAAAPAAAPTEPDVPAAVVTQSDHPTSLAMPVQAADAAPVQAMPEGLEPAAAAHATGVQAVSPEDLDDLHRTADAVPAPAAQGLASPGIALVVAMFALTFQLVAYYAREVLPGVKAAGAPLVKFDEIVGAIPLIEGPAGAMLGMLLGVTALVLLLVGVRAGVRDPGLQVPIGLIAALATAATVLLPMLAG